MSSIQGQASSYIKTGVLKSKRNTVEIGMFKDMKSSNIVEGALKELYRRYNTELFAFSTFVLLMYIVWSKLG